MPEHAAGTEYKTSIRQGMERSGKIGICGSSCGCHALARADEVPTFRGVPLVQQPQLMIVAHLASNKNLRKKLRLTFLRFRIRQRCDTKKVMLS